MGWQKYEGRYEKEYYDIKTKTGKVYKQCWPNAGNFWPDKSKKGEEVPGYWVDYIKKAVQPGSSAERE